MNACGLNYKKHLRRGEEPCRDCRADYAIYQAHYRRLRRALTQRIRAAKRGGT